MSLARIQRYIFQFLKGIFFVCLVITTSLFANISYSYLYPTPLIKTVVKTGATSSVLGIRSIPTPTPVTFTSINLTPIPTASVSLHQIKLTKNHYSLAVYGDSLEDTMGDHLDALSLALHQLHPDVTFTFYNYGIGAQNVEEGLNRFDSIFTYKGRNYPPVSSVKPDIIIIGSFAYNPFSPPDPAKHKMLLSSLVEKAKATGAYVFLLAEIAPLGTDFGKGPSGEPSWTDDFRLVHAKEILEQMQDVFSVSLSTNTPVIDVYDLTKSNGPFGSWQYTNHQDGIHPSENGQAFTAATIARSIF